MLLVGSVPVKRHQKAVLEYHQRAQRGGVRACEAAAEGRANRVSRAAIGGVVLADDVGARVECLCAHRPHP